jgi:gamma-glutamylcyclotransferase (GGCT)/AIG2-like uncharacterized protein YtfP
MTKAVVDTSRGIRVFVYGTLKMGHGNNPALAGATFMGRDIIRGRYKLIDMGWFPGVCEDMTFPERDIAGEVYHINEDVLHSLDLIEGHPNFYARRKVPTRFKNAWCYFLPATYAESKAAIDGLSWMPTPVEQVWINNGCPV